MAGGNFTLQYTTLKMTVLLHKTALVNFLMATTVVSSVGSEPTFWRAELFDKASRAKPSFFQKRRAEPSFLLSKPSQTELLVLQN